VKQKTTNLCKFKGKDWVFMGCCFGGLVQQRCGFFFFFFWWGCVGGDLGILLVVSSSSFFGFLWVTNGWDSR
jgi:hypothetical protein